MLLTIHRHLIAFVYKRTNNLEERTRLVMFIISIIMVLTGMPLHFTGFIGADVPLLHVVTASLWLSLVALLLLYIYKKIALTPAIWIYALVIQLTESFRIIYLAIEMPDNYTRIIIINMTISFTLIIYLVLGFVKIIPSVITAISLCTLIGASLCNSHAVSSQFIILFSFIEIFSCVLGRIIQKSVHSLQNETTNYMKTQDGILQAFHMSKKELLAYLQMCRSNKAESKSVSNFFSHLDEQSEKNLINAVEQRKAELRLKKERFAEHFPQLTPTELQVCRLVMNGKTVNDIARVMNKSANNISTVRIHIRKKLSLQPGEDLRQYLCNAVKE